VQRVWIALEEKAIDYQYIEINPYESIPSDVSYSKVALSLEEKRRTKYPEFISISPQGLVPALVNRSDNVCDSIVCLEYINEVFEQSPKLFSDNFSERANMRYWSIYANEKANHSILL